MKFFSFSLVILFASNVFAVDVSEPDYLITAPRLFRVGSTEKLIVNLFNAPEPWEVSVTLYSKLYGTKLAQASGIFQNDNNGVLEIKIPSDAQVGGERENAKLAIIINPANASSPVFKKSDVITVQKLRQSVFIQTDKPIYKPGQTIRMRIAAIDGFLKPVSGKITRVSVMDPNSVRMTQWDDVDLRDGMASLKMALSSQPVLGEWKIEATVKGQKTTQLIRVDKYVLPKFQVTITPPSYIAIDSKEVTVTICARYTYGQPVVGLLEASFKVKKSYYWYSRHSPGKITVQKEINGCTDLKWTNRELNLHVLKDQYYIPASFNIEARVTENATKVTQNAAKTSTQIQRYRVRLDLNSGTPRFFKPGMPFHGQLKATELDGTPLAGENVTVTATVRRGHVYGTEQVFQETFKVPANGLVKYVINTIGTFAESLNIQTRQGSASAPRPHYRNPGYDYYYYWRNYYSSTRLDCTAWKSPSNSYLTLRKVPHAAKVGSRAKVELIYTSKKDGKEIKVHYHVMSGGNMIMSGSKILKPGQGNTATKEILGKETDDTMLPTALDYIEVPVSQSMVPSCRVLVYYVRDDKETVADSMVIDVEDVLENQVSISFDVDETRPGEKTKLTVQAAPGSRVAIAAVDKSVHLLRAGNEITDDQIFDVLKEQDVGPGPTYNSRSCDWNRDWTGRRRKRSMVYGRPSSVDASKAFNDAGVLFYSNLKVETRPCPQWRRNWWKSNSGGRGDGLLLRTMLSGGPSGPSRPMAQLLASVPEASKRIVKKPKKPPSVRTEFPETWLWTEEVVSNETGQTVITAKVPDTITKWYATAFAMSTSSGIGVSSPASLTAFQPFFVSFTLPYSVVRGEEVTIITTVFNYKSDCYTIRVDLSDTEAIDLVSDPVQKVCVCGNEAKSSKFTIIPRRLGYIPLMVTAKDVQQNVCGGEQGKRLGMADAVTRKLLVEPEGVPQRYTYSSMMCLNADDQDDKFDDVIDVDLPQNVVNGSIRATVSVIGDLMGPALSVERFLRLPYGCGEQNMVNFAPNIYIMQYLTNVGQLSMDIKTKAEDFMMTGYQRELTYKRKDGSYSAFGESDPEGNMWLTAFVLRSFAQAQPFIYIDEKEIGDTIQWLKNHQQTSGCFMSIGRLFNKAMKGGVSDHGTRTAFVAVALLEAGVPPEDVVITKALKCMMSEASNLTDSYSTALFTYALSLANDVRRFDFMNKLKEKSVQEAGLTHWENKKQPKKPDSRRWVSPYHRAPSADIEMTAYALMAYVAMSAEDTSLIPEALPILRWLSKQRNSLGGFGSTQDTCVGLQALAMYASKVYTNDTNMQISLGHPGHERFNPVFTVVNSNRLVLQRVEIPTELLPMMGMPVTATGWGCALVQGDVSYNVLDVDEEPAFELTVDVKRFPTEIGPLITTREEVEERRCYPLELRICARWLREDVSNMAVVDVKLVSGFEADSESLDRLMQKSQLGLKRFELEGSNVLLYFDEIKDLCFTFGIHQETVVKKTKPASVHVYDYYETDLSATVKYNITEDLCYQTQKPDPTIGTPRCPLCLKPGDLGGLRSTLCNNNKRLMTVSVMKDKAVVHASYRKDETENDPELVDALYATLQNTSTTLYEVPLVYPKECKCANLSQMPLLVIVDDMTGGITKLVLDEKVMVVNFKRLGPTTLNDVRMLNNVCSPDFSPRDEP